jgi:hypothetical protein
MDKFPKFLRGFGPLGNALGTAVSLLTANWGLTLSAALGFIAAFETNAFTFFMRPGVSVGVGVWLAALWTWIGLCVLWDRRRPREVVPHQDYRYGLTFGGVIAIHDPIEGSIRMALAFTNHCPGPIRYSIEHFDVRLESRALPRYQKGFLTAYLPRGGNKMSVTEAFTRDQITEFFGRGVKGTAEATIVYGHPEKAPVRMLKLNLALGLHIIPVSADAPPGKHTHYAIPCNDEF